MGCVTPGGGGCGVTFHTSPSCDSRQYLRLCDRLLLSVTSAPLSSGTHEMTLYSQFLFVEACHHVVPGAVRRIDVQVYDRLWQKPAVPALVCPLTCLIDWDLNTICQSEFSISRRESWTSFQASFSCLGTAHQAVRLEAHACPVMPKEQKGERWEKEASKARCSLCGRLSGRSTEALP